MYTTILQSIKWIARVSGIISIIVLLLFIVSEGNISNCISLSEIILFAFFPFGIILGMLWGWKNELIGGVITIGCLFAFYFSHFLYENSFPKGEAFILFALPGFLFLLYWILIKKK